MGTLSQQAIITCIRPLIFSEVPGWGRIYRAVIDQPRADFWDRAGVKTIRGKRHGYLMELDISRWSERAAFFLGRWYDLKTQLLVERVLSKNDLVVDVGGNIGMFSLAARRTVGEGGRVMAFEPNPIPRAKLERHVALNGFANIEVHPFGLFDRAGAASLSFPNINTGEGSLSELAYPPDQTQTIDVETRIGDEVLNGASPRLVKIDVEGAEIGVLRGLEKTIDAAKPLIVAEFEPAHLARFNVSFDDFLNFATPRGYRIYLLKLVRQGVKHTLELERLTSAPSDTRIGKDILLVHDLDPILAEDAPLFGAR